ncbi:MAG: hypothetical protein DM484_02760 [Candidatus Methylumidiphilus alinenensis]|uniref:PEP-CTERM sorting domain-containing protein n=1 Tax=Candidatus Methylumidiphilus alinenensis TaxID=2202197 RepID=A0A2W4RSU6_9GAMM|nr:MAG: hypothetical protein DM484_02760 [Candidatus Methylumidiphilus alinenensis]
MTMNKTLLKTIVGFGCALAMASTSQADTISLTFEGLQDFEPINTYYDGGSGGFGSTGGSNYGITFGSDSLAIISGADGGAGNFSGSPTMPTIAFFLNGPGDVLDKASGFANGFSFYYSAVIYPGTVTVWSGLDGTGTQLASLYLPVTPGGGAGCSYGSYCPWVAAGITFQGIAESALFSGTANYIGFDNITLGSDTPTPGPTPTPIPAAVYLVGSALAGVFGFSRRKASSCISA